MTQETKIIILKAASLGLSAFGLLNLFALFTPMAEAMAVFLDLAFWLPLGTGPRAENEAARLWIAISGGLMVGWGATLYLVASQVYGDKEKIGERIFLAGLGSWFLADGVGSFIAGAWFNVIMNTGFLLLFCLPVLLPTKARLNAGRAVEAPNP